MLYLSLECYSIENRKTKVSQQPITRKENTFKSQWELKVKPTELSKARENAGGQVVIGFNFASGWWGEWCESSGLKILRRFSTNQFQDQNQWRLGPSRFPALQAVFLWVLIGSLWCFPLLLLAVAFTWWRKTRSKCALLKRDYCFLLGNYGNKLDQSVPPSSSTTPPTNAVYDGCYYYYLPWGDTKPCVCVDSHWEDISFRLDNLNILTRMCERLVSQGHKYQYRYLLGDKLWLYWPLKPQVDHEIIEIFIENPKYLTATIKRFDAFWSENVSEVKWNVYAVTRVFLFCLGGP